jgi:hypothetical protein
MKVIDILEGTVSTSLMDRMKARDDAKELQARLSASARDEVKIREWYNKNVQPLVSKFFNVRVFGFKSVDELHSWLSDVIYSGADDHEVFDTADYQEFADAIDGMSKDEATMHRLEHIRNSTKELALLAVKIEAKLQEWFRLFAPRGARTYRSLSGYYISPDQRQDLIKWEQTARWLGFLRAYFPRRQGRAS